MELVCFTNKNNFTKNKQRNANQTKFKQLLWVYVFQSYLKVFLY